MRTRFDEQLLILNKELILMGSLCEEIIECSSKAILEEEPEPLRQILTLGEEIDQKERNIEALCLKLLLQQQPVASDLRQISAALKMITDMGRIGTQAVDIADIIGFLPQSKGNELQNLGKMAKATTLMVTGSVDAYVKKNMDAARQVIWQDDVVDDLFDQTKKELIHMIQEKPTEGEYILDLLMIAKYYERIGDHAVNIAEWVSFSITGIHINSERVR